MSYCRREGKDVIIFATKEDHAVPSTVTLPEPERPVGVINDDGSVNWSCPCLGGMATGPCGLEFREAFSCFHYSKADPKGSDCLGVFHTMQECMKEYPTLYGSRDSKIQEEDYLDDQQLNDEDPLSLSATDGTVAEKEQKK